MIDLIILTGVYGSGRTVAMKSFEEDGFFITDNIPFMIAKNLFDSIIKEKKKYSKVALSVANGEALDFYKLAKSYQEFKVLFVGITASDEVLRDRFKLENKTHPLQNDGCTLQEAINEDKKIIRKLTDYFDVLIDTSRLTRNDFKNILYSCCLEKEHKFTVNIFSFGYKREIPSDIETVFDVRMLKNPYWEPKLKNLNGLDKRVVDFVMKDPQTKPLLENITKYLDYYIETLLSLDRNHANIGIACSAGKQRSVVIAEYLASYYKDKYKVVCFHRDLDVID